MEPKLTAEELNWLRKLDTEDPIKPDLPATIKASFVERGFAIELVEGGLQLTALGREQLSENSSAEPLRTIAPSEGPCPEGQ